MSKHPSKLCSRGLASTENIEELVEIRPDHTESREIDSNRRAVILTLPESDQANSNVRRISIWSDVRILTYQVGSFALCVKPNKIIMLQVRVLPPSLPASQDNLELQTNGILLGNFISEESGCPSPYFDVYLPFADPFDQGQILVLITHDGKVTRSDRLSVVKFFGSVTPTFDVDFDVGEYFSYTKRYV